MNVDKEIIIYQWINWSSGKPCGLPCGRPRFDSRSGQLILLQIVHAFEIKQNKNLKLGSEPYG